jgi:hypothetical protein
MGRGHHKSSHGHSHPHHAPDITHQPEVAPAPGKATGIPIVDQGPLCKRYPDKPGCFLDESGRQYLMTSLSFVLQTAMGNFQTALQNQRIRLLTTVQRSSSTWGFVAEVLFQSLSHGLIGMLAKSVDAFKQRATEAIFTEGATLTVNGYDITGMAPQIAKLKTSYVTGAAVQASKGLRTVLKNRAHTAPAGDSVASAANVDKADFLTLIQNGIGPMANSLFTEAPAGMTDGELAAMAAAYGDMTYHSVAAYEDDVLALLDQYDKDQIASIGDGLCNGIDEHDKKQMLSTRHAAWISAGVKSRLAIVEVYDPIYAKTSPIKGDGHGHAVKWEQSLFVSWVSDDLLGVAQDYQAERNGAALMINATNADTGMPEIDAWAKEQK